MNIFPCAGAVLLLTAAQTPAAPLVVHSDVWHYKKGTGAPQADWKTAADAALDASWLTGPGWIGFGDGGTSGPDAPGTLLSDMRETSSNNGYRMVYLRRTFTAGAGIPATEDLVLEMDFDDAFIAWIDGQYVDHFGPEGSPPAEPEWDNPPEVDLHECSFGNSSSTPQPVRRTVLGKAVEKLTPGTHTLAVLLINETPDSSDAVAKVNLYTREPLPPPDLHWTLSDSPVTLTETVVVAADQELVIEPGVEVRCPAGSDAIDCAGRIRAEGTKEQPIRFVRADPENAWNRIRLTGTQESVFRWCDFDGANTSGTIRGAGTSTASPAVVLDRCRWLNTDVQMVDLTWTSCEITYCEFDSIGSQELIHFSNMPATGRALIKGCIFGTPGMRPNTGYNDIVDFTGGNRPGPIVQFIGNIFLSCVDDCIDMDSTDAHIEGNIFLDVSKDANRDSSSNPITTGAEGPGTSELVICRNVFYNGEHMFMNKNQGHALIQNNTVVRIIDNPLSNNTDAGGDEKSGLILFGEPWRNFPYGAGVIFEGNIATEIAQGLTDPWPILSFAAEEPGFFFPRRFNCIQRFPQPGEGNIDADPMLLSTTGVDHTNIFSKFGLQAGSPCRGTGPNGIDMGAVVPAGASISGQPTGTTTATAAHITAGGPGIWSYQWRLDGGAWSAEVSLVPQAIWDGQPFTADMLDNPVPVILTNLAGGTHTVEVRGKNSAGAWQEEPYATAVWTVSTEPDTDGDGMPDAWETANNLDPENPADAALDGDGDAASNAGEFLAGTNPQDRSSVLVARAAVQTDGTVAITFTAVAGKSYRVQASDSLNAESWTVIGTVAAPAETGPATVTDANASGAARKFYRVVTP